MEGEPRPAGVRDNAELVEETEQVDVVRRVLGQQRAQGIRVLSSKLFDRGGHARRVRST
jgi:hypothetical protein